MANYFDLEDFVFAFILVGQERKKEMIHAFTFTSSPQRL